MIKLVWWSRWHPQSHCMGVRLYKFSLFVPLDIHVCRVILEESPVLRIPSDLIDVPIIITLPNNSLVSALVELSEFKSSCNDVVIKS